MMKKILPYLVLGLFVFVGIKSVNASEFTGNLNPGLDTGIAGVTKAVPTLSPAAGEYHAMQSVSLTAAGASNICYTTNGTTAPTCASATTCNVGTALVSGGTISISSAETIKSVACYGDGSQGPSGSSIYTFTCSTASLANGSVSAYPTCGLSCNSGYTLNGSTCVAQSTGGGGGGGGGGYVSTPCSSVTYGDWQSTCFNGIQYRNALTMTPSGCSLTSAQQTTEQRTCQIATTTDQVLDQTTSAESTTITPKVLSVKIANVIAQEKKLTTKVDSQLIKRLAGRILLQVERFGQAWYLDAVSLERYYLADGPTAYEALRKFGLGIKNSDLDKIPVALNSALPSNYSTSTMPVSSALVNRLKGRIVLQVENHGEAWYINPTNGQRYYLANGEAAYQIMRNLSLGISDINIHKITVGSWK